MAGAAAQAGFNTQPPEGGWNFKNVVLRAPGGFNTQPPEGGWLKNSVGLKVTLSFNTQPPEGGWRGFAQFLQALTVSTHSRPKAAGEPGTPVIKVIICFNTQPPEGGWTQKPVTDDS